MWSVAGSDNSAGAGIQADLKTGHCLGAQVCTIVTTVTAQNHQHVLINETVSITALNAQFTSLIKDESAAYWPAVIKIGVIPSEKHLRCIVENLQKVQMMAAQDTNKVMPFVVYDPVLVASCGAELVAEQQTFITQVIALLLPWVTVITPNKPELLVLAQCLNHDVINSTTQPHQPQELSISAAINSLLATGCNNVLLKGGHDDASINNCDDYLFTPESTWLMRSNRKHNSTDTSDKNEPIHFRGTGCTLSSALSAALALGFYEQGSVTESKNNLVATNVIDAAVVAKAYINQTLDETNAYSQVLHHGGWPERSKDFPQLFRFNKTAYLDSKQPHLTAQDSWLMHSAAFLPHQFCEYTASEKALYPVVPDLIWLERMLQLGISTVQIRVKVPITSNKADEDELTLEQIIAKAVALGQQYKAKVFINDHWQLAIKYQAYGVHLGQEDLQIADLTAIKQAGLRLGISTHSYSELLIAKQLQPSYIALGHIFATNTKQMSSEPQGLARLARYLKLVENIPTVAIGGIKQHHLTDMTKMAVDAIAVVTAITEADDWHKATLELLQQLEEKAFAPIDVCYHGETDKQKELA